MFDSIFEIFTLPAFVSSDTQTCENFLITETLHLELSEINLKLK